MVQQDVPGPVRRGPDLRLTSRETRSRVGPRPVVLRYEFRFWQDDQLVYFGDQSAMFVKDREFTERAGSG